MKIFLSFLQSKEQHPIPAYSFWQYYIKRGIEEAGHSWLECPDVDWAKGLVTQDKTAYQRWKEDTWARTVSYLKNNPADMFLSYLYPQQIDVHAVTEVKRSGIPCVNFFCDNVRNFIKAPAEFSVFDLNWVPEHKAVKLYQKAGYRYINLPMPIWVEPGMRTVPQEKNKLITFIGSKDIQRLLFFEEVVSEDPEMPIIIYGEGWNDTARKRSATPATYTLNKKLLHQFNFITAYGLMAYWRKINNPNTPACLSTTLQSKTHGSVDFSQYNHLTRESMITAGINRYPSFNFPLLNPDSYSRLRDIEAPMLGACYLTEWTEGIEDLYDINNEIFTYKNVAEFVSRAKYLQQHAGKRNQLRVNGQRRALHDHSIVRSLNKIMEKLS